MQPEEDPSSRTEVQNGDDDTVTREARGTETGWNNNTTDNCPERHRYNDSRDASYPSSTTTEDDGTDMDSIPSTDSLVQRWLDGIPTTEEDDEAQDRDRPEEDATTPAPADEEMETELNESYATPYPDDEDTNNSTTMEPHEESQKGDAEEMLTSEDRDERPTSPLRRSPPGPAVRRPRTLADTIHVLRVIHWCSLRLVETVDADERVTSTTKKLTNSYARQMRDEIGRYLNAPYDPFPEDA